VILVIDTSSARSGLALLAPSGETLAEETHPSGRDFDLPARARDMRGRNKLTKVAVAIGPGSFTGLRVGVSFGLGLAIGLRLPIIPLKSLEIQAARSEDPVIAATEAGRGRIYHLWPGREPALAEPRDLRHGIPVVGWLRPATEEAVNLAGLRLKHDGELLGFGAAAARCLESAHEVAYGSLRLEYMQSFSARA
jgi:tRNA A37 threonylcarbamoyladenosine modification protein TsaB